MGRVIPTENGEPAYPDAYAPGSAGCHHTGFYPGVLPVVSHCVINLTKLITHYISGATGSIAEVCTVISLHLPKANTYLIGRSFYRPSRSSACGSDFLLRKSRVPREQPHLRHATTRHVPARFQPHRSHPRGGGHQGVHA